MYEKLGDVRGLLVARTNLAMVFWKKDQKKYREKVQQLLCLALEDAQQMKIPEAKQIEGILEQKLMLCFKR